jgi:hypothetical protein
MKILQREVDGILIIRAENEQIAFEIAPQLGGRILSVYNKKLEREFLWHNQNLTLIRNEVGADYDSNFWGGIDELLPNDLPETIDSVSYPDHGELWTAALGHSVTSDGVTAEGLLPLSGLYYRKTLSFLENEPVIRIDYNIRNDSRATRHFLWKLHAALEIEEGDKLLTSARRAKAVYAESSRSGSEDEFAWPSIRSVNASEVPAYDRTMDFYYLYDVPESRMAMLTGRGSYLFEYAYDGQIFPYQWYFASYGQFDGHYTAILEPASAMPVSVQEAQGLMQCSVLEPGQEINTVVTIYAGPARGNS